MYRIGTLLFSLVCFFVLPIIAFQNCSSSGPITFSGDSSLASSSSIIAGNNGDGYLGKPEEGDYQRTFPNYQCSQDPLGVQGTLNVTAGGVVLRDDSCADINLPLSFNDSRLEYSIYNRDYLGLGSAIYERVKTGIEELPIAEAHCRWNDVNAGLDVIIKIKNDSSLSQAKIYRGQKLLSSNDWLVETVSGFNVTRTLNSTELSYRADAFSLQIDETSAANSFYTAQFKAKINDVVYDYPMICRQKAATPINLNEPWELDSGWLDVTQLMGYWKLNEANVGAGSNIVDSSGRGHNGAYGTSDPPSIIKSLLGKIMGGLSFDSAKVETITIPYSPDFEPNQNLTLGMWVNFSDDPSLNQAIFGNTENGGYYLETSNGTTGISIYTTSGLVVCGINPSTLQRNRWYHMVGTYDGLNARLYIDGQIRNTCSSPGNIQYSTQVPLCIGAEAIAGACNTVGFPAFSGALDDLFLFNRVLSNQEILSIYNRQSHLNQ